MNENGKLKALVERMHDALVSIDIATIEDVMAASDGSTCEQIADAVKAMRAERDALRADNQRLRAVIQRAIVGLEVAGDFNLVAAALNERDHLRAALDAATPADGNGNEVAE